MKVDLRKAIDAQAKWLDALTGDERVGTPKRSRFLVQPIFIIGDPQESLGP